jgi:3-hydroxyisobutyrate dehydrogenase
MNTPKQDDRADPHKAAQTGMQTASITTDASAAKPSSGRQGPNHSFGVVGLGAMGFGAASSLLRAGCFEVWGCDVREDTLAAFEALGGKAVSRAADLVHCDAVMIMVVNAAQTEAVLFETQGLLGPDPATRRMRPGSVILACATVAPEDARALALRIADYGVIMLDTPVSGGPARAAQGSMTVMGSGPKEGFNKVKPLLDAVSANCYQLGEAIGLGSTVKMVNQLLAGVHIAAAAEAMALGIRSGANPQALYEVISNSAGNSWMFENRVPHILQGDYTPLSAVNIFVKDLGIVLDSARKLPFPLPLSAAAHQMYLAASAAGYGLDDDAAVIQFFAKLTGIELPKKPS